MHWLRGYYINHVVCLPFALLVMCSTIILNALAVLVFWRSSQLRKKTSYFLIMLLSLSDLGVGIVCAPLLSITLMKEILGVKSSQMWTPLITLGFVFSGLSWSILFVLNVERYLGIVHPLFHKTKVNKSRVLKAVSFLWFNVGIVFSIVLLYPRIGNFLKGLELIGNLTILITLYVKIFLAGGRKAVNNSSDTENKRQKAFSRNIKLAKSCLIVISCSYLCLLPLVLMSFLPKTYFVELVLRPWTANLLFANSTLNSVVLFWRNQTLRNEAKVILRQTFKIS